MAILLNNVSSPPPKTVAAGYDAKIRTGAWQFSWTNIYQRNEYYVWTGIAVMFGNTDDCLYFESVSQAGDFNISCWAGGAKRWAIPFVWTQNQPVTFTIDVPNARVTIAGAAIGNGVYNVTPWTWQLGDGTLRVGSNYAGTQNMDPQISSNFVDPVSAPVAVTSALTGVGTFAGAAKQTAFTAGLLSAASTLTAAGGKQTIQVTSALSGSGSLGGSLGAGIKTTGGLVGTSQFFGVPTVSAPNPYTATGFQNFPNTRTNVWPYGQPLLVRDKSFHEVICPVRATDGNVYLLVSEDQGQSWRQVTHSSGLGSDPLYNQNLLTMRQDGAGKYHLLSHDINEGVVYTRFVLNRNGSNTITTYTRETHIYRVFGDDMDTEHVANVVVVKNAIGVEGLVLHVQPSHGFGNGQMTNFVMKCSTTTPTVRTQFTKLDGSAGRDEINPGGLTHNPHEHVSHAAFFESNGSLLFTRSHSSAEGFTNATGYNDFYWLMATRTPTGWSLGSWNRYQTANEGLHTRSIACADNKCYFMIVTRDVGLHISSVTADGQFTLDATPRPNVMYPQTAPNFYGNAGCITTSKDGQRILGYFESFYDDNTSAGQFADYTVGGSWRLTAQPGLGVPPYWNYGCSTSTGDDYGLYMARSDGTYGNTTPTLAAYRRIGDNIVTDIPTTAALSGSSDVAGVLNRGTRTGTFAGITADSVLVGALTKTNLQLLFAQVSANSNFSGFTTVAYNEPPPAPPSLYVQTPQYYTSFSLGGRRNRRKR